MILTTSKKSAFFISSYCNHGRGGHKWRSNFKNCVSTNFFYRRNKTILPTQPTHIQQICVNKFVQGQNFWKISALSEFEINSGHFFVKLHKFVDFPDFSPKNRPAQGDYKLEVLTQHIFVVDGGRLDLTLWGVEFL